MNGKRLGKVSVILVLFLGLMATAQPAKALGTPQIVSIDPGSPAPVGTTVRIRATVQWDNDFRSMRICFRDENWCQEDGSADITKEFNTSGLSAGTYSIIAEVAAKDKGWDTANKTYASYELTGGQPQQPTPTPQPQTPPRGPNISTFQFNPAGGATVGDNVDIHIVVDSSNPGATKINVSCGGVSKIETSEVDFHSTWYTNGCSGGQARVDVYSRDVNDPNWTNPSSASKTYNLSAPPSNAPTADFWADSKSILSGQCTYLHWTTTDADTVDIDGSYVGASGDKQVCPTVTKKYTLTAKGPGGTAYRNLTVVVTSQPTPKSVASSFNTGDIINIGGNIHVIVDGQRRLVPNPETLDALGITRSMINNRGYSDAELNTIPPGPDIPDVNRDPAGFQAFKDWIFPNLNPILPASTPTPKGQSTPTKEKIDNPAIVTPTATVEPADQDQTPESGNKPRYFWCYLWPDGPFCRQTLAEGYVNLDCKPQCVATARIWRPDLNDWALGAGTPNNILKLAQSGKKYTPKGQTQEMQIRVRDSSEQPQAGDLAIWPGSCVGGGGHIGYVTSGNPLRITDSNWGTPWGELTCWQRTNQEIPRNSCIMFIPPPFPADSYNPPDKCDQYTWFRWLWCKITGW